jgi:DNA-directed RNA polymerase III subunit RPC8
MLVFRPRLDAVLVGRIKSCSRDGVQISLGFFDEIFVGPESLQHPARFDETENVWVWEYPGEEEGSHHDLFMDIGEPVRFRVAGETFTDTGPSSRPDVAPEVKVEGGGGVETGGPRVAPYALTATLNEPGLGLLSWWT